MAFLTKKLIEETPVRMNILEKVREVGWIISACRLGKVSDDVLFQGLGQLSKYVIRYILEFMWPGFGPGLFPERESCHSDWTMIDPTQWVVRLYMTIRFHPPMKFYSIRDTYVRPQSFRLPWTRKIMMSDFWRDDAIVHDHYKIRVVSDDRYLITWQLFRKLSQVDQTLCEMYPDYSPKVKGDVVKYYPVTVYDDQQIQVNTWDGQSWTSQNMTGLKAKEILKNNRFVRLTIVYKEFIELIGTGQRYVCVVVCEIDVLDM